MASLRPIQTQSQGSRPLPLQASLTIQYGKDKAWAAYKEEDHRMLILDWMMPELDGLEVCERIRAENRTPYTYILMLTSLEGRGR